MVLRALDELVSVRDNRSKPAKLALSESDVLLSKMAETVQHADIYNRLGFSLRKSKDYKSAYTYYQKAIEYDPAHKGAHEYLGELYVETGDMPKAKEMLAKLRVLCPKGCEEREDLEKAIREANAKPKSAAKVK